MRVLLNYLHLTPTRFTENASKTPQNQLCQESFAHFDLAVLRFIPIYTGKPKYNTPSH